MWQYTNDIMTANRPRDCRAIRRQNVVIGIAAARVLFSHETDINAETPI